MKEQDAAYQESLRIDQLKSLKIKLKEKWGGEALQGQKEGIKFWLRFSDTCKVYGCLAENTPTKILYEVAFAYNPMLESFYIYTLAPRRKVTMNGILSEFASTSAVFVVENTENAPCPLELLKPLLTDVAEGSSSSAASSIAATSSTGRDLVKEIESARVSFMIDKVDTYQGLPHPIQRAKVYSDVLEMYQENLIEVLKQYPFRVEYEGEMACDTGGVCRDLFSCFWEEVFLNNFDGEQLLVPCISPEADIQGPTSIFKILGTILSHGFMVCGFLPVRVAFPVVAAVLLGTDIVIPDNILIDTFVDFLASHESSILRDAVLDVKIGQPLTPHISNLISILSRFGCKKVPSSTNLLNLIVGVSKHCFISQPFSVLHAMRSGVPKPFEVFWKAYKVEEMYTLYKALNATTSSVLHMIDEPEGMNCAQKRVFSYLMSFIGNMKRDDLRLFLRFVTGSSVMLAQKINVSFNNITGIARRPISHTCDCGLELSIAYSTFPEFEQEFYKILQHEYSWIMDAL